MKKKKTFPILMIPTEKDGVIWKFDHSDILIIAQGTMVSDLPFKKYDLFVVSKGSGTKENDYVLWGNNHICQVIRINNSENCDLRELNTNEVISLANINALRKIEATTDKGLGLPKEFTLDQINLQIPQINASYVRRFVEDTNHLGVPVAFVDLEMDYNKNYPMTENNNLIIKVNPDNTVIITPTKNDYTGEEVAELILKYREFVWMNGSSLQDCRKWIKENIANGLKD